MSFNKRLSLNLISKQLLMKDYRSIITEEEFIEKYNELYQFYNDNSSINYKSDSYVFPHDIYIKKLNKIIDQIKKIKFNNNFSIEDKIINIEKLKIYREKLINIKKLLAINFNIIERLIKERREDKEFLEDELSKILKEYDKCIEEIKESTYFLIVFRNDISWINDDINYNDYLNNYYNMLLKLIKSLGINIDSLTDNTTKKNIALSEIEIANYLDDLDNSNYYIEALKKDMENETKILDSSDLDFINEMIIKYKLLCNTTSEYYHELKELYEIKLHKKYKILELYPEYCIQYSPTKDYKKELYKSDIEETISYFEKYKYYLLLFEKVYLYNIDLNIINILKNYKQELLDNSVLLSLLLYETRPIKKDMELIKYNNKDYLEDRISNNIIGEELENYKRKWDWFNLEINIKDYLKDRYSNFKKICNKNNIIINDTMSIETFIYLYCNIYNEYKELIDLHKIMIKNNELFITTPLFKGISSVDFSTKVGKHLLDLLLTRCDEVIIDKDVKEFILKNESNINLPRNIVFSNNLESLCIENLDQNNQYNSIVIPSTIKSFNIENSKINKAIINDKTNNYEEIKPIINYLVNLYYKEYSLEERIDKIPDGESKYFNYKILSVILNNSDNNYLNEITINNSERTIELELKNIKYNYYFIPTFAEPIKKETISMLTKEKIEDLIEKTYYGIDNHFLKSNNNKDIEISENYLVSDLVNLGINPITKKNDIFINKIKRKFL